MTRALYPGSFDPVTFGHVDIATRAAQIFEHLTVAIYETPNKELAFSAQERVEMMREALSEIPNIDVLSYNGLTVDFARHIGAKVLVRGLRVIYDFELEYQMALTNQKLGPDIDTVCLMTSLEYAFVSSSLVKEIFRAGGCIDGLVPPHVIQALGQRFGRGADQAHTV
jgi:pantetheine-phosphate adenylyltransferase